MPLPLPASNPIQPRFENPARGAVPVGRARPEPANFVTSGWTQGALQGSVAIGVPVCSVQDGEPLFDHFCIAESSNVIDGAHATAMS
jgi:hypothetical protein